MNMESWMAIAVLISGIVSWFIAWQGVEERRQNIEKYGLHERRRTLKKSIGVVVFSVSILIIMSWLYLTISAEEKDYKDYKMYLAGFESLMFAVFLTLKYTEKFEGIEGLSESLFGFSMIIPLIAIIADFFLILLGYLDLENEQILPYGFALIAIGFMIGASILVVREIIMHLRNSEQLEEKIEKFIWGQKKNVTYMLIVSIIAALAVTI